MLQGPSQLGWPSSLMNGKEFKDAQLRSTNPAVVALVFTPVLLLLHAAHTPWHL